MWTSNDLRVAKYFATTSKCGREFDSQVSEAGLNTAVKLPSDVVRQSLVKLKQHGHIDSEERGDGHEYWARAALFYEFDKRFVGSDPKDDAEQVYRLLEKQSTHQIEVSQILSAFPGWNVRRLNPALQYLAERDLIKGQGGMGSALLFSEITARSERCATGPKLPCGCPAGLASRS